MLTSYHSSTLNLQLGNYHLSNYHLSSYHPGVQWLIRLRWLALFALLCLAISDNVSAFVVTEFYLICLILGASNCVLQFASEKDSPLSSRIVLEALLLDLLILTFLLAVSGGAMNPFSILYLVYITLAAVLLGERGTWMMALLSSILFGLLFFIPDLHGPTHSHSLAAHLQGMWVAFVLGSGLTAFFLTRILAALKYREAQLSASKLEAAHAERLTSLATLAAGAAHELGTPLATISVIAGELNRFVNASEVPLEVRQDAKLLRHEVERCRKILNELRGQADETEDRREEVDLATFSELVLNQVRPAARTRVKIVRQDEETTLLIPKKGLIRNLAAVIHNAVDASSEENPVQVEVRRNGSTTGFVVKDSGQGMPEEIAVRACEPFFTTKSAGEGMGLGLYLAKEFCARNGGDLSITSEPSVGTEVTLKIANATDG